MTKRFKPWELILSSLLILLPIPVGLLLWPSLPEAVPVVWVIVPPLVVLALHWLVLLAVSRDPKNREQTGKVLRLSLWLLPLLSLYGAALGFGIARGQLSDLVVRLLPLPFGLMFLLIGNYLPKCRRNSTIGIRVPWTFASEENWNRTHRFSGRFWVLCGLVMLLSGLLPEKWAFSVFLPAVLIAAFVPIGYSFALYCRQRRAGEVAPLPPLRALSISGKIGLGVTVVIVAAIVVTLFTGNIGLRCGTDALYIEASYWSDRTVAYDDIDAVEYLDSCEAGLRTNGFGSPRLLMGSFRNDEFGNYTRYSYTGCDSCVVLWLDGRALVLGAKTPEATRAFYEQLLQHVTP